jgi:hypothetical protein
MKTYKEKTVTVVDDIKCDACGASTTNPHSERPDFATLEASWGYGSINDGMTFDIQVCENCFLSVIDFIKSERKKVLGPCNYPHYYDPLNGKQYL